MLGKTVISSAFVFGVMIFATMAMAQQGCSHDPVEINGQTLYEKCHCESLSYPELEAAGGDYGVRVIPGAPVGYKGYFDCGIELEWIKKPSVDLESCLKLKKEAIAKINAIKRLPKSYLRFHCGRNMAVDQCIGEGNISGCIRAQEEAERRGDEKEAAMFKRKKCERAGNSGPFWDDLLDCEGMVDFLNRTCADGKGLKKKWACQALAKAEEKVD